MRIEINGESKEVQATNLGDLLAELGSSGRVATALNEEFVGAAQRESVTLSDGDRVEILAPMQGG